MSCDTFFGSIAMKKKCIWIAALFAALALILTGCGGGAGNDPGEVPPRQDSEGVPVDGTEVWYLATGDKGLRKWPGNKKELWGESDDAAYVHIFFNPYVPHVAETFPLPANQYNRFCVEIDFKIEGEEALNLFWQCAYDPYGTWARASETYDYIGPVSGGGNSGGDMMQPETDYTIRCRVIYNFPQNKGNWNEELAAQYPDKKVVDPSLLHGLCIQIPEIFDGDHGGDFVLKDIRFVNYDLSNNPATPELSGPVAAQP
jgi:hypothetical protein